MRTISINIPDSVHVDEYELKLMLAAKLYEQGKISLGEGAELAGVSKRSFIELLSRYKVSVFNYDPQEIEQDFQNA